MDATTPPVPPSWFAATAEFLSLVDWAAALFVVFVGLIWLHLLRMDDDKKNDFKLVQFVTSDGKGNSASLAYVGVFVLGAWLVFYLVTHDKDVEVIFSAMLAAFGVVRVWTANIGSKERMANPGPPPTEPPPPES